MLALLVASATACSTSDAELTGAISTSAVDDASADSVDQAVTGTTVGVADASWSTDDSGTDAVEYSDQDLDASEAATPTATIMLNGGSAAVEGTGVTVAAGLVTITTPGTFLLQGSLDDGQIVVDAGASADVRLILDGVSIARSTSSPLYVRSADKVVVTLAAGSENRLADGESYLYPDDAGDETEDGQEVLTFTPTKQFQSLVLSSAELETGVTYVVYVGGISTGAAADGLYSGGAYTPGTEAGTFTL